MIKWLEEHGIVFFPSNFNICDCLLWAVQKGMPTWSMRKRRGARTDTCGTLEMHWWFQTQVYLGIAQVKFRSIVDIAYGKFNCDIVAPPDMSPARVTCLLWNCQCGKDTERLWRNTICYNNILYTVCVEVSNHCTSIRFRVYRWLDHSLEESSGRESLQPRSVAV